MNSLRAHEATVIGTNYKDKKNSKQEAKFFKEVKTNFSLA